MSKHTPGPWIAEPRASGMTFIRALDGPVIAKQIRNLDDASLMESAPDMLEALEDIIADAEYLALVGDNHARRMKAKAAIAKAKGETS